jgi:hypothetical protein
MKKILTQLLLLLVLAQHSFSQEIIEVDAQEKIIPIKMRLNQPVKKRTNYVLKNLESGAVIPAQLVDSAHIVFIPELPGQAGPKRKYTLISSSKKNPNNVALETKANGILIKALGKPVLFYHTKEAIPPPDSPAYYKRSGFIHPLYSPSGLVLTDDFPAGHAHQHGIFMTWVNTTFKSSPVDFWNQHNKTGTVEHVSVIKKESGPVFGQLITKLRHKSHVHGAIIEEQWTITVYALKDYFIFDLASEQKNIASDTLHINKYHYGGLAFRGSKQWNSHDTANYKNKWTILTSEGHNDSTANHTHAGWVDASGKIDGNEAGVTIIGSHNNFRYPQAIRVHPDMPYWCYAPMVDGAFTLDPGQSYRSNYRFFVHEGTAEQGMIESISEF